MWVWELHCRAEVDPNGGAIDEKSFIALIRKYLEGEGYDTSVVDSLFEGMVERVVALVSRIQGTYEFEVQPLREYFAARHLFETAPYSPTGNERTGTRPDRFDAVARNSYWLNVTRFLAGCFSKGELPALADSLEELWNEKPYHYLERPKVLGAMLLSDWVFSQHPKSQQRCTNGLFQGATLRHATHSLRGYRDSGNPFIFSVSTARDALLDRCFRDLATGQKPDYEVGLCMLARANGAVEEVYNRWRSELCDTALLPAQRLLRLAVQLGVVDHVPARQLEDFLSDGYQECLPWIVFADRRDVYCASAARYNDAVAIVSKGGHFRVRGSERSLVAGLAYLLDLNMFSFALSEHRASKDESFRDAVGFYYDTAGVMFESGAESEGGCAFELQQPLRDLLAVYASESTRPVADWMTTLEPWDNLVEMIRSTIGTHWGTYRIAKFVTRKLPAGALPVQELHLLDQVLPLCSRAVSSRRFKDDSGWWKSCLLGASNPDEMAFVIMMIFEVASDNVIVSNLELMDAALSNLPDDRWAFLVDEFVHLVAPVRPVRLNILETDLPREASARLYTLVALQSKADRAADIYTKHLLHYSGGDNHVWRACMGLAIVASQRRRTLWPEVLLPLRRGYGQGATPAAIGRYGLYPHSDETARMPMEVAMEICRDAFLYPLMVLDRAETALQVHVEETRTSVSEIAKRDRWFDTSG
jgi:hypothetical protein